MNDLFFTQVNTFATRDKNILDLVLTPTPELVTDLSVTEGFLHSDHLSISFSISTKPTCTRVMPKEILDFKRADMNELNDMHRQKGPGFDCSMEIRVLQSICSCILNFK